MASDALVRLTLVGRRYCSLCDKMRAALLEAARFLSIDVALDEIDLDETPHLEPRFNEWVPVLLVGDAASAATATEICHYHFDDAAFRAFVGAS